MDEKERKRLNNALRKPSAGKYRDTKKHFNAMQSVMSHNCDMRDGHWKIVNCSAYRPCNQSECLHCGAGVPFRDYPRKPDHMPEHVDATYLRGKTRNFRANAGRDVARIFDGFEDQDVHDVTLGIFFGTKEMDCMSLNRSFRRRFRSFMKERMPNAVIYLVADIAVEKTATFASDWPVLDRDIQLSDPEIPAGLFLHAHGFIADHDLTERYLRRILKQFFIGTRRVEIGNPHSVKIDDKGRLRGGYEGYVEYAAMEKYDLDLPDDNPDYDNIAMFEAMKRCRMAWPRNARKTKINHRAKAREVVRSPIGCHAWSGAKSTTITIQELRLSESHSSGYKWSDVKKCLPHLLFKDLIDIPGADFFGRLEPSDITVHTTQHRLVIRTKVSVLFSGI